MRLHEIIPNDPLLEDLSRRGFLKGLGGAAALTTLPSLAIAGDRDQALEAITKTAGTAWDFRRLGWSRSAAMTAFETQMGYRGELLRVAGIVCNFAWSVPKDHYTRNEFIQIVRQQASENLPRSSTPQKSGSKQNNAGSIQRSPEPSAGYIARVKSRISANIVNNPELQRFGEEGNVTVEIKMDKEGDILSQRIVQSSGFKRVDDAVMMAIQRTQVLPRDIDGRVPPTIKLNFEITSSPTN
jgi:TonB family protein